MKRTSVGKGRKAPRRAGRGGGRWAGRFKAVSGWVLRVATVGGVCLGASILFVSFYQYLLSSPHIRMEKVVFHGAPGEIQRDLMARAGLASGANLLALKLRDVRRKMETHPWVRRVALERQFPHTLLVRVEMHEPVAVVLLERLYYMNAHGELFKEVGKGEVVDYPVVTGVPKDRDARGRTLQEVAGILSALAGERNPAPAEKVSEIHVQERGGVSVYFEHLDVEVKLADGSVKDQIRALRKVIAHLETTGRLGHARVIDFNYGDGAVVSFERGYKPVRG